MARIKLFTEEKRKKLRPDLKGIIAIYNSWKSYDKDLIGVYPGPERMSEHLLKYMDEGSSLLDVACGTGLSGVFYKENKNCIITGIDLTNKHLERAGEKKLNGKNIYSYLEQANVEEKWNFKNNAFDVSLCIGVSEYMADMGHIIGEMARVSKKLIAFNANITKDEGFHYHPRKNIIKILEGNDLKLLDDFKHFAWGDRMYSRGYIAEKLS